MNQTGPAAPYEQGRPPFVIVALDRVTGAALWISMAALAAIFLAYNTEVVSRYALNSPTRWSAEFVSYFLLVATFTALPRLTRDGGRVAVTVILEKLPSRLHVPSGMVIAALGALICATLAWIAAEETFRQISRDIRVMAAVPIPKALVSAWMVFGLALTSLQFLRIALLPGERQNSETKK